MKLSVQEPASHDAPRLAVPVNEKDHAQGPADAPVTLVEYGDYECPYCGNAYPIVKRIQKEMGPRLRFVFRNFPLNTIHAHAGIAAQAAEAAAAQGKFWEMHDLLYEHQQDLEAGDMVRYALKLGLEIYRFESDLSGEVFAKRVSDDFRGGVRSGVNGTPTFFINGVRYNGPHDYDSLKAALDQAASQSAV
jgi:protein-disulfide isomerase